MTDNLIPQELEDSLEDKVHEDIKKKQEGRLMGSFRDELAELERKAERYDRRKEVDNEAVEKINQALAMIKEAMNLLRPKVGGNTTRQPYGRRKEILHELYQKIQDGVEVTSDLIEKSYNIESDQIRYLFLKDLRKMPNVESRKDGQKRVLYAKR